MKPASGAVLKRKGHALVVEVDGEAVVEVERFYGHQTGAVFDAGGVGASALVITEASVVPEASQGAAQVGVSAAAAPSGESVGPLLGVLTLGGIRLASLSGGNAVAPIDNTVVAKVVGGPIVKGNDLIATIYAADGTTVLGQGAINDDGTVTVKVGSYLGVVIVKVQNDQNPANNHPDYMDEAAGVIKDLGDAVLSSMGEIATANGVITLNVNILTALAYHEAAEVAKGAPLSAALVRDTNAAVAKAFGLESLTGGDIKTNIDQGGNPSASNTYGESLAALSGADKNNGGSVKATLDALIEGVSVTGATATVNQAAVTLLTEGAKVIDPSDSKGLISSVQSALQSGITTPPSTPSSGETTAPTASVTTATITSAGSAVLQSTEPGTAYLVRSTVAVTSITDITTASDNQWNSVTISAANTATNLAATGLVAGTYKVYTVDQAGNLSATSTGSITITPTPVELSDIAAGSGGFVINGQSANDQSGGSVASAGDVNGDGLADLIIGAWFADPASGVDAGKSYVVFGKSSGTAVDLSAIEAGSGGFVINAQAANDRNGAGVATAGDVNGDGLADLIVGAWYADTAGGADAGKSYVIFGSTSGAFSETADDELGTTGSDTLSDSGTAKTLVGGAGNDSLAAAAASVLYGGGGNESFQISAAMITALQLPMGSGGNVNQLARIDGGNGIDTIALSGGGLALDLTQIANQSASNTNGSSRIQSIEVMDLTGTGNNTLKLRVDDVFDMTGFNTFAATGRHQLLVKGDAGDLLDLDDGANTIGWTQSGT